MDSSEDESRVRDRGIGGSKRHDHGPVRSDPGPEEDRQDADEEERDADDDNDGYFGEDDLAYMEGINWGDFDTLSESDGLKGLCFRCLLRSH